MRHLLPIRHLTFVVSMARLFAGIYNIPYSEKVGCGIQSSGPQPFIRHGAVLCQTVFVRPGVTPYSVAPHKVTPVPCTTNLAEHTQAFLGKPGSKETQLAIRVKWYYEAHLGFDLSIMVSHFRFNACSRERGVICVIFFFTSSKWIDQEQYIIY